MSPRWLLYLLCGVVLFPCQVLAEEGGTRVAVVDLAFIFEKYAMTRDLETAFEERRRRAATEADSRREAMESKRKKLLPLKPDSREFADLEQELTRLQIEFEVWATLQEKSLKEDHKRWLLRIYTNVREVVAKLAVESQIDLVVTYDRLAEDAPDSLALRQQILLQNILYFNDRIDLTQTVLARVNEQYDRDGGAAGLRLSAAPLLEGTAEPDGTVAASGAPGGVGDSRHPMSP
ncbi:MAG: OmpH family outer membrane protein [bacterium]|nr:OmpH family outer membrane protein [bacterium]